MIQESGAFARTAVEGRGNVQYDSQKALLGLLMTLLNLVKCSPQPHRLHRSSPQ
jgi:hypothetical protein